MSKKKICIAVLLLLPILVCLGVVKTEMKMYHNKGIQFNEINSSANMGDAIQGQYVLVAIPNRLKDFPFCTGEQNCIYDIKTDKTHPIGIQWNPFGWTCEQPVIFGNNVFMYSTGNDFSDSADWTYINLENNSHLIMEQDPSVYSISDDNVYYVQGMLDSDEKSGMYVMNCKDFKSSLLMEDYISSMAIFDQTLYWTNPKKKTVNLYDLTDGSQYSYPDETDDAQIIQRVDDRRFVVFYESGKVNLFEDGHLSPLCVVPHQFYLQDTVAYREGYLYYYDDSGAIHRIDINTGDTSVYIEFAQYEQFFNLKWDSVPVRISYSDNYIVAEIEIDQRHRWLFVCNYDNDIIRIKRL